MTSEGAVRSDADTVLLVHVKLGVTAVYMHLMFGAGSLVLFSGDVCDFLSRRAPFSMYYFHV